MKKIKVFTIDDSPPFRQLLREIINSDEELEYCGYASNGALAVEKLSTLDVDVITLDIEMPEMDGLETLKHIMSHCPKPVIMVSSFTRDGAEITFKALEMGAVDYIQKPDSTDLNRNIRLLSDMLISKIKIFSNFKFPENKHFKKVTESDGLPVFGGLPSFDIPEKRKEKIKIICIGSSTGGTVALTKIIPQIHAKIGVPIMVVQHMPPLYTKSFSNRLNSLANLRVVEAQNDLPIEANVVYIAQGGYHMKVKRGRVVVEDSDAVNNHKPSVDVLFSSIKEEYGSSALGVILTGMGSDGASGLAEIKDAGGYTVAQDEESSVIFGMPGSAIRTGKVDRIIPLDKISHFINKLVLASNKNNH